MIIATPVIVSAVAAGHRRSEQEAIERAADPIRMGFDEFCHEPEVTRKAVAEFVLDAARRGEHDPEAYDQLLKQYAGAVTTAVVHTASSTGLTALSPTLLFRTTRKHVAFEHDVRSWWSLESGYNDDTREFTFQIPNPRRWHRNAAARTFRKAAESLPFPPRSDNSPQNVMRRGESWTQEDLPDVTTFLGDSYANLDRPQSWSRRLREVPAHLVVGNAIAPIMQRRVGQELAELAGIYTKLASVNPDFRAYAIAQINQRTPEA